jgi:hypothetical protein
MISIKVAQHYENSTGKKIGFKESSASPSIYSRNFPILADFVESDLDRIIDCKMASDMNVTAAKYFGYDGLNKLAQINETYMSEKSKLMDNKMKLSRIPAMQAFKDNQIDRLTNKAQSAVNNAIPEIQEQKPKIYGQNII